MVDRYLKGIPIQALALQLDCNSQIIEQILFITELKLLMSICDTSGKAMLVKQCAVLSYLHFYGACFFPPDLPFDLKFEEDTNGKITGTWFKNDGSGIMAKRME